jgi:hypothetical protein
MAVVGSGWMSYRASEVKVKDTRSGARVGKEEQRSAVSRLRGRVHVLGKDGSKEAQQSSRQPAV